MNHGFEPLPPEPGGHLERPSRRLRAAVALLLGCFACDADTQPHPAPHTGPSAPPAAGLPAVPEPAPSPGAPAPPAPEAESAAPPVTVPADDSIRSEPIAAQRAYLIDLLRDRLGVEEDALERVRKIFDASEWIGFGNPRISTGAMSRAECHARRASARIAPASPECRAPHMVRVPGEGDAPGVCIDQFEFPNVPCEFPVVWVRASEAQQICEAMGKRLCDAHEWEGGCAGRVLSPETDYAWDRLPKRFETASRRERRLFMEHLHNEAREVVWAYGPKLDFERCGTQVRKDARCSIVDWGLCATRSYPAGAFPECVSPRGVYDQHGNVAEHMSLPLRPTELGRAGGSGWTEMKGSWFAFAHERPHLDDCRWRAKNWHTTAVSHWNSHRNYHLGFRCCKDVP
jgi:formylglycine-generating enzyme